MVLSLNHPDLNSVYADFWFSGYKYPENMLYTRETAVYIDTSKKALKMLSIIIINIFIDCYTCFYYFFNTRTHYMSESEYLTVGRRSRDLRPLSRDRSVTFLKIFPNCLKRPKTLFDSRPTVA